jgi:HSP20 family protein
MSNIISTRRFPSLVNPLESFRDLNNLFDTLMTPAHSSTSATKQLSSVPHANVTESEKGYKINLAVPGFSRDNFSINVEDSVLTISGGSDYSYEGSMKYQEFNYTSFTRSWTLPQYVNSDQISASYTAGILSVDVPMEGKASRSIDIVID